MTIHDIGPAFEKVFDRVPPFNEGAEQAVLAAMMTDPDAISRATEILTEDMLFRTNHRVLFGTMVGMSNKGTAVDPLTLVDQLERDGQLGAAGGREFIAFLIDAVPTTANVEFHAKIVKDKALYRRMIEITNNLNNEAYTQKLDAGALWDIAESQIFTGSQSRGNEGFAQIRDLLGSAFERIKETQKHGRSVTGVPTGFVDLDEMTTGLQPADLVIIAARPSMGKTSLVMNIAEHAAIAKGIGVAFFSLEMSKDQLVTRLLTSEGRIDAQRLRKGQLHDDEMHSLGRAAGILAQAPIFIDDTPGISILEARSKARRLKAEHNVGLVVVDYLQLMQGEKSESRQQEVSSISRGLKALAKELKVPVIALSQLSRNTEQRTGDSKRPQLSDLRESGAIEQDADIVMFIYREEVYAEKEDGVLKDPSLEGKAEIIVGKQRNGPIGFVNLFFQKQYTRFENVVHHHVGGAPPASDDPW